MTTEAQNPEVLLFSMSLKRVNYNTIYALLFSLILSVSLKKNKVLYSEKFK